MSTLGNELKQSLNLHMCRLTNVTQQLIDSCLAQPVVTCSEEKINNNNVVSKIINTPKNTNSNLKQQDVFEILDDSDGESEALSKQEIKVNVCMCVF